MCATAMIVNILLQIKKIHHNEAWMAWEEKLILGSFIFKIHTI